MVWVGAGDSACAWLIVGEGLLGGEGLGVGNALVNKVVDWWDGTWLLRWCF